METPQNYLSVGNLTGNYFILKVHFKCVVLIKITIRYTVFVGLWLQSGIMRISVIHKQKHSTDILILYF